MGVSIKLTPLFGSRKCGCQASMPKVYEEQHVFDVSVKTGVVAEHEWVQIWLLTRVELLTNEVRYLVMVSLATLTWLLHCGCPSVVFRWVTHK